MLKSTLFQKEIRSYYLVLLLFLGVVTTSNAQSMNQYITPTDTLVVYSSIPRLTQTVPRLSQDSQDVRVISDKYTIKVRSAATNNIWVDVFAHYTYNRNLEVSNIPIASTGVIHSTNKQGYPGFTAGWSQTYGNIEMSRGQSVQVEIAAANPAFKIKNLDFFKAKVHPASKASTPSIQNNKVYFTITNPGQIVIDINGQMDDHNALINPIGAPIHTISLFANPVIAKPSMTNSRTFVVRNGVMPTGDPANYDTVYFEPGPHNIGQNNKIYPGKSYYIPGDAIVFGTFNNLNVPTGSFSKTGENIKFFGYGTISGATIRHDSYVTSIPPDDTFQGIYLNNGLNYSVSGITIADPSNFSLFTPSGNNGTVLWAKVIAWRANGDGLAGNDFVNDCFMRTSDDSSYTRGNRNRCTFWKDHISGIFYMAAIPDIPLVIENCDIIYCRSRVSDGLNGGLFNNRGSAEGSNAGRESKVNLTFRNIRVHDPLSNLAIFNIVSFEGTANAPTLVGNSYDGILFQNIQIANSTVRQRLLGCAAAPFNGGIIFDNVTFGSTLLTPANSATFFQTNEFVTNIWYRMPNYFLVNRNVNPIEGSFTVATTSDRRFATRSSDGAFIENSTVSLTAVALPGYVFDRWTDTSNGSLISTANPASLVVTANRSITANFTPVGTRNLTITTPTNGSITSSPTSPYTVGATATLTAKPAAGFRFNGWTGEVSSQNIITTAIMDKDKTVSANFVRTNDFGVNFGGDQFISADGTVYALTNAGGAISSNPISGTNDDLLYQTRRSGPDFTVGYTVENGQYEVTLKFAEGFVNAAGLRIFSTFIEGVNVLPNFDIFAAAGATHTAVDRTFLVTVTDGNLTIRFLPSVESATINAIKITRKSGTVPTFNSVPQYCYGENYPPLPTTALNNGITGAWSPAINNLATTTYTFTPNVNQNALSTTLTVNVGGFTTWNGTTWSNGVPNSTTKAIISGNYAQPTNFSACSLEITGGAVVSVPSGFNYNIAGKVAVSPSASLTFENNSNLVQVENTTNTGMVSVKRNSNLLSRLDYTIWSSPVTNANQFLTIFSPLTSLNRFYTYNESTNLFTILSNPASTTLNAGTGYLFRVPNTHPTIPTTWTGTFIGVPNNGVVNRTISFSGPLFGFNMVGNPYPSAIDADSFITLNSTQIESILYFWRKVNADSGSAYAVYSRAGSTKTNSSETPNGIIQAGQGFFVKAKSGASTITFNNSMRRSNNTNQFFKNGTKVFDRLWLNMTSESGVFSQLMIGYFEEAEITVDAFDARYINDSPIALTSILNNEEYSIQGRSKFIETDVVPLQFKTNIEGEYKISLDRVEGIFKNGQNLFLVDSKTGVETNLNDGFYSFVAAPGIYNNRFYIKYQKSLSTEVNEYFNDVTIYKQNDEIHIKSNSKVIEHLTVYDAAGKQLAQYDEINSVHSVLKNIKKTNQVLFIKIVLEGKVIISKKVIY